MTREPNPIRATVLVPPGTGTSATLLALLGQTSGAVEVVLLAAEAPTPIARNPQVHLAPHGCVQAISMAQGALIGWCPAGQIWSPDRLAAHVRHFAADIRLGVSIGRVGDRDVMAPPRAVSPRALRRADPARLSEATLIRRAALPSGAAPESLHEAALAIMKAGWKVEDVPAPANSPPFTPASSAGFSLR